MKKLCLLVSLLLIASCTVSHRITPLEKRRYEVQVTKRNIFRTAFTEERDLLHRRASQVCPHYRLISKDRKVDVWGNKVTYTWLIECPK